MQRVTSRHNPRLREAARLVASARDRRKAGRCVLEGEHLVGVYRDRYRRARDAASSPRKRSRAQPARALAARDPARTLVVPTALFAELATLPAGVGMLAVVPTPRRRWRSRRRVSACCSTTFRTPATWARCCARPPPPACSRCCCRSTARSRGRPRCCVRGRAPIFFCRFCEDVDLAAWAAAYARAGGDVVAMVAAGGRSLYATALTGRIAVAIGNEGAGLSPALAARATLARHDPDAGRNGIAQRRRGRRGMPVRMRSPTRRGARRRVARC